MQEIPINGWVKLGSQLRAARRSQGLSQAELAHRAGVARSWLARVEAGHRGAELETLLRLLAALDLTLFLSPKGQREDPETQGDPRPVKEPAERVSYATIPGQAGTDLTRAARTRREAWGLGGTSEVTSDSD